MDIQELCSPPPLWVGVVSSRNGYGYTGAMFPAPPAPPVVWWGCGTAYIYIYIYVNMYEYVCIYIYVCIYNMQINK